MKHTAIVIGAAIIVALGVVVVLYRGGEPSAVAPVVTVEQEKAAASGEAVPPDNAGKSGETTARALVTFTDAGYSPSTLTVKAGTTVAFENKSSKPSWVASAMHPSHAVYPTTGGCLGSTFDACHGIEPGGSWSFKFDIAGTWRYHDHLNPNRYGAIVVE